MPPRGRKPKPTHLKLVEGNRGKRALNKDEPVPERALPSPPAFLSDAAKVEWGRVSEELYRLGLLSNIDRAILAAYCQTYGQWQAAETAIAAMAEKDPVFRGLVIETTNGNLIQNPLVGVANRSKADLARYAAEIGMTPSARSRISTPASGQAEAQDPAQKYFTS